MEEILAGSVDRTLYKHREKLGLNDLPKPEMISGRHHIFELAGRTAANATGVLTQRFEKTYKEDVPLDQDHVCADLMIDILDYFLQGKVLAITSPEEAKRNPGKDIARKDVRQLTKLIVGMSADGAEKIDLPSDRDVESILRYTADLALHNEFSGTEHADKIEKPELPEKIRGGVPRKARGSYTSQDVDKGLNR